MPLMFIRAIPQRSLVLTTLSSCLRPESFGRLPCAHPCRATALDRIQSRHLCDFQWPILFVLRCRVDQKMLLVARSSRRGLWEIASSLYRVLTACTTNAFEILPPVVTGATCSGGMPSVNLRCMPCAPGGHAAWTEDRGPHGSRHV